MFQVGVQSTHDSYVSLSCQNGSCSATESSSYCLGGIYVGVKCSQAGRQTNVVYFKLVEFVQDSLYLFYYAPVQMVCKEGMK